MSGVINEYSYRIQWSEEDGQYIGTVLEFPLSELACRYTRGGRAGIKKTVQDAIHILREEGAKFDEINRLGEEISVEFLPVDE